MAEYSWDIMRSGDVARAISQMRTELAEEWNPNYKMASCTGEALELGIAYLWQHDYRAAEENFDRFNKQFPNQHSSTYEMAGTAKWCLGGTANSAQAWWQGLHCDYSDTAGLGVTSPLLLFFGAVFEPGSVDRGEVEGILEKKAGDSRSEEIPLVQFVLGEIQEQRLRDQCDKSIFDRTDARFSEEIEEHHWRADFWLAVLEHERGNDSRAKELFRKVGHLTWDDYDRNSVIFLTKLWTPEFFLARHEAGL